MKRKPVFLIPALLCIVLCGCATVPQGGGRLEHVVLCWLKEPGNSEHRQQIIEAAESFRSIPGVLAVSAGEVVPSDRKIVDDSFDVGLIVTFPTREAMQAYLVHPDHTKAKHDVLLPIVKRILVYDFESLPNEWVACKARCNSDLSSEK